eukprot:Pompholyxophrys_punicea_v1_NODE_673_length_1478_cov_2.815882.p3 type:complete len:119 gc:universal NODE_673_length_1478_cov_2.815882:613-257(-)
MMKNIYLFRYLAARLCLSPRKSQKRPLTESENVDAILSFPARSPNMVAKRQRTGGIDIPSLAHVLNSSERIEKLREEQVKKAQQEFDKGIRREEREAKKLEKDREEAEKKKEREEIRN